MREPVVEEQVKVGISNEQLAKMATSAAHHFREVQELEDEVKQFTKSKKIDIEDNKAKASSLLEQVRLGYKYETVLCHVVRDHVEHEVYFIQTATCELVRQRPMKTDEQQMEMDDRVPENRTYDDIKEIRKKMEDGDESSAYMYYGLYMTRHPQYKLIQDWIRKTGTKVLVPANPTPNLLVEVILTK